ncbi:MAG: helix-turn-helix transcriptional regulator [Pseudomonadota bacterium]
MTTEDIMISVNMMTLQGMQKVIAGQARALRLELNLSQQTLSAKSGVSYGSLKKFEQTGQISLESLLKLAVVLGVMDDFKMLFAHTPLASALSLDELIESDKRKRGRK